MMFASYCYLFDRSTCRKSCHSYHSCHAQEYVSNPQLEVPSICKAYFLGLFFREYPHKIWPKIWYQRTSINWILKFPLINGVIVRFTTLGHPLQGPAPRPAPFPEHYWWRSTPQSARTSSGNWTTVEVVTPCQTCLKLEYTICFPCEWEKILKNTDGYSEVAYFQTIPYVQEWVSWDLWEWGICVCVCVCDKCHATNAISAHEIDNFPHILKKGEWVGHLLLQTVFDFYIYIYICASPALETFSIFGHLGLSENLGENQATPPTSTCESSCSPWKWHNTKITISGRMNPPILGHIMTRRVVDAKRQQCRNQPLQRCLHEG